MLEVTKSFKQKMATYGKQINVLLEFGDTILSKNKIISSERDVNGELFTSICRLLTLEVEKSSAATSEELLTVKDISSRTVQALHQTRVKYLTKISEQDEKIIEAAEINVKLGVKLEDDEDYEYVDWGKFVVYDFVDSVDTNSYKLTLYDHLIDTHIKYNDNPLNLDFSSGQVTVGMLLQAICDKFGFVNKTPTFTNSNKIVDADKYANLDVTYRDILDEIAGVAFGFIKIFNKDLYVAYPQETGETIDENDLKKLKIGKKVGPFNTVVLSRSPQEDNIYYPASMENNDNRIAIRIENNQIMDSHREDFIVDLYNRINGLEYYVFDCEHFGFGYYEFGDIVTLKDLNGKTYKTIVFNIIDNIDTGITGKEYSEKTEFAETKYEYATSIEKRIKNTEIICNKQDGEIRLLVKKQASYEGKIAEIELDIDTIRENVALNTTNIENVKIEAVQEAIKETEKELGVKLKDYPTTIQVETLIETKAGEIETSLMGTITTQMGDYVKTTEMQNHVTESINSYNRTITQTYITKTASKEVTDSLSSQISANAKSIQLKLDSSNWTDAAVIALINNGSSTAKIKATNLELDGFLTITNANSTYATYSGLSSGSTIVDGACIKTGVIDAIHLNISSTNNGYRNEICASSPPWLAGAVPSPSGRNSNPIVFFGAFNQGVMNRPRDSVGMEIWENGEVYMRHVYTESGSDSSGYMAFIKTPLSTSSTVDALNYIVGHTSSGSRGINVNTYAEAFDIYAATSDENLKENMAKTKVTAMDYINRIEHIEFDWKETKEHQQIGYKARQLRGICKDFVSSVKQPERFRVGGDITGKRF